MSVSIDASPFLGGVCLQLLLCGSLLTNRVNVKRIISYTDDSKSVVIMELRCDSWFVGTEIKQRIPTVLCWKALVIWKPAQPEKRLVSFQNWICQQNPKTIRYIQLLFMRIEWINWLNLNSWNHPTRTWRDNTPKCWPLKLTSNCDRQ